MSNHKNTLISSLTLGLVATALTLSPVSRAFADDQPVTTDPQKAQIQETRKELKAKKEEIKQDKEKLKEDMQSKGKDSAEVQADKAELKKDRAERKALADKKHGERRALRKAKKPVTGQPSTTESQPAPQQ